MVFPIVVSGCERWIIKKAECSGIDAFKTVVLEKTLEYPLDSEKFNPVNPKGNQPEIFTGKTDAEAEAPIFLPNAGRANSLEKTLTLGKTEGKRRRG